MMSRGRPTPSPAESHTLLDSTDTECQHWMLSLHLSLSTRLALLFCLSITITLQVNERGRRQNRTLSFRPDRVESLRGDSVRFAYDSEDIHSIVLHPQQKNLQLAWVVMMQMERITNPQEATWLDHQVKLVKLNMVKMPLLSWMPWLLPWQLP